MKNTFLLINILFLGSLSMAREIQGTVLNLVPDDEGTKVVTLEVKAEEPVIFYLDNRNKDFDSIMLKLSEAKTAKIIVKIKTQNNGVETIQSVEK